jgi:adenylate cyclase
MLGPTLYEFNEWVRGEGLHDGFAMGVGLNSGVVMTGQVGSERRVEYTAIGDTTNTAARLEGMTKGTPHSLFLSSLTKELLSDDSVLVFVDELEVRGRQDKIGVWTVEESETSD